MVKICDNAINFVVFNILEHMVTFHSISLLSMMIAVVNQRLVKYLLTYKWVTRANLGAPFCCLNWMEIQHGGANKVANDIVE